MTRNGIFVSLLDVSVLAGSLLLVSALGPGGAVAGLASRTQDQLERTDLLTFAQGALFVSQSGMASGSAGNALRVIDGDSRKLSLTVDGRDPITIVYKLLANTTFDRLAIPNVLETPGNATFFRNVIVSGSLEGPDLAYQVLARATLDTHGPDVRFTELELLTSTAVRYVKIELSGGINILAGDEGRTNLEFTELIGNGRQEEAGLSTAFSGLWDFRITERLDRSAGLALELTQTGARRFASGAWLGINERHKTMDADNEYAEARITLDGAMAEYIKKAQAIGVDNAGIARDVCDSLFDASDGDIKLDATLDA
jgi:hypothetical protein